MKIVYRASLWIVLLWTAVCVMFVRISFPEVFNARSGEAFSLEERIEIKTSTTKITEIVTKKRAHLPGFAIAPQLPLGNPLPIDSNASLEDENGDHIIVAKKLRQELRQQREEKEREYYTLRDNKVNPIVAKYIINGANICSTDAYYMTILIIVPSIPSHYFVRDTIRSTYGSYAKNTFKLEYADVDVTVRLAFLVGKDNRNDSDATVREESVKHGDIIYADFIESYNNLTRKMLIALHWVSMYCSDVDFLLKIDEDVFVNIPRLAKELHKRPFDIRGSIYGHLYHNSAVYRKGKWGVSKEAFPLKQYPSYAAGNSYVISGNIVSRLFTASEYLPYFPVEDAFITGCLARIIDTKLVFIPGFTYWSDSEPDPCKFVRGKRISATKVTTSKMEKLWKACTEYKVFCDWRNLKRNLR